MDAGTVTYRLDQFEGPLDLLLTLIQKNKVSITDIPIAIICDQYMAFITEAQEMDMDIASEFIVMASELMLIKSKMLLPRAEEEEEDPRAQLTDALLRYQQAKEASAKLSPLYAYYSGRMVKDTDEISVDKTYVQDQDVTSLCTAIRRIIAYNNALEKAANTAFTPMISKPIIPVEIKIVSLLKTMEQRGAASLEELIIDEVTLPDLIASFLGVLELVKLRRLLLLEPPDAPETVFGADAAFVAGDEPEKDEDEYLTQIVVGTEHERDGGSIRADRIAGCGAYSHRTGGNGDGSHPVCRRTSGQLRETGGCHRSFGAGRPQSDRPHGGGVRTPRHSAPALPGLMPALHARAVRALDTRGAGHPARRQSVRLLHGGAGGCGIQPARDAGIH